MATSTVIPAAIASRYEELRRTQDTGQKRTILQEELMKHARAYMSRSSLNMADIRDLWTSPRLGLRILVLAHMYEKQDMRDLDLLIDGIEDSRSAFEQYHAMQLISGLTQTLPKKDLARTRATISRAKKSGQFGPSSDRCGHWRL